MKRITLISALLLCAGLVLNAQKKITFMPQWTAQAQFAGFYVALEKGFYVTEACEGLYANVKEFTAGNEQNDDITIVVIRT